MSIEVIEFTSASGSRGFAAIYTNWGITTTCTAAIREEGGIEAGFAVSAEGSMPPPQSVHEGCSIKSSDDASWAMQMFQGHPGERLLDKLRIPHVDRRAAKDALAAGLAPFAEIFSSEVDIEAFKALEKAQFRSIRSVSYYTGESEKSRRRRQGAHRYPILADLITSSPSCKFKIDTSSPDEEAVLRLLSGLADTEVGKPVLNKLRKAHPLPEGCDLAAVVRFAAAVPEWVPTADIDEWRAFCHVAMAITVDFGADIPSIAPLVRSSKGKWCDLVDRIVKAAYPAENHPNRINPLVGVRNAFADARGMAESFQSAVVLPLAGYAHSSSEIFLSAAIRNIARESACRILFLGRPAVDVVDMARRYGQERHAILAGDAGYLAEIRKGRIANDLAPDEWPALSGRIKAPNGVWLVPLQSYREFKAEGKALDHCVGRTEDTYAAKAKDCTIHIVSARWVDDQGEIDRLSTAEFAGITSGTPLLSIVQHHGMSNGLPPTLAADAMNWYVSMVESGKVAINWEEIRAYMENRLVDMDDLERTCDFDWRDRNQIDAALIPWVRFFTKPYRESFESLLSSPEIQSITAEFPPDFMLRPAQ